MGLFYTSSTCKRERRSVVYALGSTLCLTLAMFIWMKLRVVTGLPRTAYAEPELSRSTPPKVPAPATVTAASSDAAPDTTIGKP